MSLILQIHLYSGTKMDFVNNSASWGGAISVRSASVGIDTDIIRLFNTRCFLQYEIENTAPHKPPSEWNVSVWRATIQLGVACFSSFQNPG